MFKGSWQDKFHFIIPFISMPLSIVFAYFAKIEFHLMFIVMPVLLTFLQALNEAFQAIDPKLGEKYGSYENFQINSKRDWKYFGIGLFAGCVLAGILVGVLSFYTFNFK